MSSAKRVRVVGRTTVHESNAEGRAGCGVDRQRRWGMLSEVVETDEPRTCTRPGCDPEATATLAKLGAGNLRPGGRRPL